MSMGYVPMEAVLLFSNGLKDNHGVAWTKLRNFGFCYRCMENSDLWSFLRKEPLLYVRYIVSSQNTSDGI